MINKSLYYACALLHHAPFGRFEPAESIAQRAKIPVPYAQQLCKKLAKHGLLKSTRGRHGGFCRPTLCQRTIGDVIQCFGELQGYEHRILEYVWFWPIGDML